MSGLPCVSAKKFLTDDKSIIFDFKFLRYLSQKALPLFSLKFGGDFLNFLYQNLVRVLQHTSLPQNHFLVKLLYCPVLWYVLVSDSCTTSNSMFAIFLSEMKMILVVKINTCKLSLRN